MFPWNMFNFNKDLKGPLQGMKPQEIETYIQDMVSKVFTQGMPNIMNQNLHKNESDDHFATSKDSDSSSVFETHDHVFVRIPLKKEEWLQQMKVFYTSNQLILEHVPEYSDKKVYTLPATVKKKGASATFKEGVLEVKIPKNIDLQYSEIQVTEL